MDAVAIPGYKGKWSSFADGVLEVPGCNPLSLHCMEHDYYGDETEWLLIDDGKNVLWSSFDCIEDALKDWVTYCEGGKEVPQDIQDFFECKHPCNVMQYFREV